MTNCEVYGEGEELGDEPVLIVVLVSVLVEAAGDSFTMVVFDSFFSAGGFSQWSLLLTSRNQRAAS